MTNPASSADVLDQLSKSEDDLLFALGRDLAGPQAVPLRPAELAERARRWLAAQQETLQAQVCESDSLKQFVLATSDSASIAVELAKLLAGLVLPVNPVTLAVLIVKKGVKSYCATRWARP